MKIKILHGENTFASYNRLQELLQEFKKRDWEVIDVTENEKIEEILISESLFKVGKVLVLEPNMLNKHLINFLENNSDPKTLLIFYSEKTLSKAFLSQLPNASIEEFKLPKLIWAFLDSIYPGNSRNSLKLFHKLIEKEHLELVFYLLFSRIRDLYLISIDAKKLEYPPWLLTKLQRQASKFTTKKLKEMISELADADIMAKTSKIDLEDAIDFIFITKLE